MEKENRILKEEIHNKNIVLTTNLGLNSNPAITIVNANDGI